MALNLIAKALIKVIITVASIAYQAAQQKKMKAAADKRKGFEFTVSGESAPLPVVYGKQAIGGVATSRKVTKGFEETSSTEDTLFAEGLGTDAITGTKNEFLHVQYALCQGGIEGVQWVLVNGLTYDDADAGFKHRIRIYNDTIASSPATHEAMGFSATNLFTGAASSTATYRLNRNDYNYNGEPQVSFLMKGRKVRAVELNTGVYSLASTFVYSNNPVLVLIDYMTNIEFGRGLPVAKLDLESFYNAAAVCDTVVTSGRAVGGVVNVAVTALTGTLNAVVEWPLTGTMVGVSGTTVTASGSLFTTELVVGEQLTVSGQSRTVTTISSDTSLVISSEFNHSDEVVYSGSLMSRTRAGDVVTGVGTVFTTELVVGDEITMGGQTRTVATIESDTRLTVGVAFDVTREYSSAVKPIGTRDIPLYECNITLDTEDTIRENIERILQTMGFAEMMWSPEGRYKLSLDYPTTLAETNALIPSTHVFTDDNILRDEVALSWLSASERSNQATVNFLNEHEDFKEDSMTWPVFGSTVHNTYLTEDNQQPLKKNFEVSGITDPYHALARAEQEVRKSRELFTIEFTADKQALSVELGDLIKLTLSTSGLTDEIFKVNAMEVRADMSVKISAYSFSHEMLTWNVNDDIAYAARPVFDFTIEPVTSLVYTAGRPSGDHTALAELTWVAPIDGSVKSVVYYTDGAGELVVLGETSSDNFFVYPHPDWADGESVTFTVKAQTPLGRLSTGVSVTNTVVKAPAAPTSFSAAEVLYQTNKASGVKARATISFSEPVGGVEPKDYKVEYYRDEDGSTYALLGYTVGQTYVFNDIRAGNYHFKITPISWFDDEGTPLIGTKVILGLSAIPADPTGFTSKATDSGILLTWDTPSDLDVVSGGTTEIRYVRNDVVTPKWEIAQTIVNNISGSTTTATLPIAAGYYLIKHIDSSGNACAEPAQLLNSFVGPDFNAITTVTEDPTFAGTKTNCAVHPLELATGVWATPSGFDNTTSGTGASVTAIGATTQTRSYVDFTAVIGATYSVSLTLDSSTIPGVNAYVRAGSGGGGTILTNVWLATAGATETMTFIATTTAVNLLIIDDIGADFVVSGVTIKEVVAPTLALDAAATTMTYLFDNDIDLGSVENIRLVPNLTAVITDGVTVVADYDPISSVTRFAGPIVDAAVNFEVRHTDDDPAGTPTWSDWETFTVGNYRHRAFQFRLTGVVAAAAYTVNISELSLTADKADVYKRGTSTSSSGADTTVTFAAAFYGGIGGTDLPHVGSSTIGGSAGDSINIVSITKSAFVYSVYNSGARAVRNISWQAIGQ